MGKLFERNIGISDVAKVQLNLFRHALHANGLLHDAADQPVDGTGGGVVPERPILVCLVCRNASRTAEGYVAGDRTLGLLVMYFITGATIFSAFAFLGAPGFAYSKGAAVFYILAYGALGMLPFYFLGPRAARLGRRYGFVTQAEMISDRYDKPAIAGLMALISIVAFVPYLALQMKGAGTMLHSLTRGHVS